MSHRSLRWGSVLLILLAGAGAARSDEAVPLRWRFKKGQEWKYLLRHREVRAVAVADQKFETTTTTEYEWRWTVQDIDDQGMATLGHKFTTLRVASTGTDFDFRYDSSRGNQSADEHKRKLIDFFDQLRFAEYQVQLKPDGRVAKVNGFDKLLGEVGADATIADFHALNLHDDSFGWYLQQVLGVLPAAAVAEGAKWEHTTDAKLGAFGQLSGRTDFVLGKLVTAGDRPCRAVQLKGEQTLELDTKWLNLPIRGTLKTTKLEGTVCFDPKAGAVQSGTSQAELAGELKLGEGDKPALFKVTFQHALELEAKP
jgi:hypothetical protein